MTPRAKTILACLLTGLLGLSAGMTHSIAHGALNAPHGHWGSALHYDCPACVGMLGGQRPAAKQEKPTPKPQGPTKPEKTEAK